MKIKTPADEYRTAKKLNFKPNQVGGIKERMEKALGRDFTEDEVAIIELMVMPGICGSDQYGSHDRLRENFERFLKAAAEESRKTSEILARIEKTNPKN